MGFITSNPWRQTYNFSVETDACVKASETFTPRQEDTTMLKVTIFALALLLSGAAIACPFGYVPCGEAGQLCCPGQ